jgi:nitroimidazol reductase NimA-like FMN-containing flavoprotein (pyridoxamine 5'-phosphate oxidase superfamily)
MVKLSPRQVESLNKLTVGRVATVSSKEELHVVPVCYVLDDGNIYFATDYGAKKVRNLKENRKISIIIDQYFEDWSKLKGILIQGEAELIEKGPEFAKIRDLLHKKYP